MKMKEISSPNRSPVGTTKKVTTNKLHKQKTAHRTRKRVVIYPSCKRISRLNIGSLNVFSWQRSGSAEQTVEQLAALNMEVQELRRCDFGNIKVKTSTIFNSSSDIERHEFGMDFVVNQQLFNCVMHFKPINERICYFGILKRMFP